MLLLPWIAIVACQLPPTELSKQSRAFFEKLIDVKLEAQLLVFKGQAGLQDNPSLRGMAMSAFPGIGRVSVRTGSSSSSTHRGGGGEVSISIGEGGGQGFVFRLVSPGGDESVSFEQQSPGGMTLEATTSKSTVRYEQSQGKCKLQVKAGAESFRAAGKNFAEILRTDPVAVKKHLLGVLELYFDRAPFVPYSAAPPGKTIVVLRDGATVFGELELKEIALETAYGRLTIPRGELVQVLFSGAGELQEATAGPIESDETVVVTRRFTPRGRLETARFRLKTPYGDLEVDAAQVLHMAFGPDPGEK